MNGPNVETRKPPKLEVVLKLSNFKVLLRITKIMAEPKNVNGAITDAVTQANVKVLADSPAMSLSNLYQTVSQSLSLSVRCCKYGY